MGIISLLGNTVLHRGKNTSLCTSIPSQLVSVRDTVKMRGIFLILALGTLVVEQGASQFLNNRPFPTYSLESMPDTGFTCRDKILGGYYADPETQCQMFHICVKVAGIGVQDFRFLCPNATAFDQDHQICADWDDVDCDATTLYYSSDNFDLYRLGSGFESKAVKYGEEEETFALQRAETGDARLNREHQAQRVNQQKQYQTQFVRNTNRPLRPQSQISQDAEKDIFKGSSSSNFFNNRNNGKELDDDFDDGNVNSNQNRDYVQKKKIIRKQQRRPQTSTTQQQSSTTTTQKVQDEQTQRPYKPTGFVNNFAGSSYQTTTQNPSSVSSDVPRIRNSHRRGPQQLQSSPIPAQTSNGHNFNNQRQTTQYTISTPAPFRQTQQYIIQPQQPRQNNVVVTTSTENYPSNFPTQKILKQTTVNAPVQQTNFRQQQVKQAPSIEPVNYSTTPVVNNLKPSQIHYDVPRIKVTKQGEDFTQTVPKQPTKNDNYPTTFAPKVKFDFSKQQSKFDVNQNQPTTFAPRNNAAYTQQNLNNRPFTNQQQFNNNPPQQNFSPSSNPRQQNFSPSSNPPQQNFSPSNNQPQQNFSPQQITPQHNVAPHSQPFAKQFSPPQQTQQVKLDLTTQKTTPFTQYTPTVPKVTSTTPVSRSNRFDETQYDDGSYNSKYDSYDNNNGDSNHKDDEFLKTAHSQNIANSRNEFIKNAQKQSQVPVAVTTSKPFYNESPRPFSASPNTPKFTEYPKTTQQNYQQAASVKPLQFNPQNNQKSATNLPPQPQQTQQQQVQKQQPLPVKSVKKDYDYAYYDSNADEYDDKLDEDIPKEFKKTQ